MVHTPHVAPNLGSNLRNEATNAPEELDALSTTMAAAAIKKHMADLCGERPKLVRKTLASHCIAESHDSGTPLAKTN